MFLGTYTTLFESSVSPWTTLGPLGIVISISLCQEAASDWKRHRSDHTTNHAPCVVLRRADDLANEKMGRDETIMGGDDVQVKIVKTLEENRMRPARKMIGGRPMSGPNAASIAQQLPGKFVPIAFQKVQRMNIRAGDIVLVKNREMIPADIILLGSSGENGGAYIETSPIDGETNLKLRNSPQLPISSIPVSTPRIGGNASFGEGDDSDYIHPVNENIEQTVKRLTRMSLLGRPCAKSSLLNPNNGNNLSQINIPPIHKRKKSIGVRSESEVKPDVEDTDSYVATLVSELPNASVNTFSGKITLPPPTLSEASIDIPLDAENILLRGAMLRNTEWVLGVACFTGDDTKLARNSIKTPSKFSRLDELMNRTVVLILMLMIFSVLIMSTAGYFKHKAEFEDLWYAGFAPANSTWPYLPEIDGKVVYPNFRTEPPGFHQFAFTYITLLNNFVPLSLYVTVEMITLFMMFLIGWDRNMYHEVTDTAAAARSTIVTDLGQVKYVFSDKTGTLTQNVMRFKRCSVDSAIFGAPVVKANPNADEDEDDLDDEALRKKYHRLEQLLVGSIAFTSDDDEDSGGKVKTTGNTLTFNAEMFLRVMSICHTVVVEKEIDASNIDNTQSNDKKDGGASIFSWRPRSRANTGDDTRGPLGSIVEARSNPFSGQDLADAMDRATNMDPSFGSNMSVGSKGSKESKGIKMDASVFTAVSDKLGKSSDGSPKGFAYQAESPDEGALVSAASLEYGFQLISRDSSGVKLSCTSPSLLSINDVSTGLKNGSLSSKRLAAETACPRIGNQPTNNLRGILAKWSNTNDHNTLATATGSTEEVWPILAVNKFDSTRKRMSVLVRSPPELGSIPMLLIKGADSSMLDPDICEGGQYVASGALGGEQMSNMIRTAESCDDAEDWEKSVLLNMQSQLGIFASEGLRTLVLGVRILTENESDQWLKKYNAASTAIDNRDAKLTTVAQEIEKKIHIVGSTAIEDKLQDGVPETIYNIARAGIKLWVLTGDKRETAIEIGYSTKVLNPKMHVTDVADGKVERVKALVAMEFIRLVKIGKLPIYQKNYAQKQSTVRKILLPILIFFRAVRTIFKFLSRAFRRFYLTVVISLCGLIRKEHTAQALSKIDDEAQKEGQTQNGRQAEVRKLAELILEDYKTTSDYATESKLKPLKSTRNLYQEGVQDEDDVLPEVFHRASNANTLLGIRSGSLNAATLRGISLMAIEANENSAPNVESQPVIDDDVLSMTSKLPGKSGPIKIFNKKKRTLLEKMFAIDRDVRKGRLIKHLTKDKRAEYNSPYAIMNQQSMGDLPDGINATVDRALVIEGSALVHFLGDPLLEELLFAVASSCESVIACRVSPKQKALLVKLVKQFVVPSPVTLAIGDGANDVGMIQEAQVGVGISGLEGQQAVNSSDFSIAQFRFLEDLLLVHGRWNFMRLSKTVLFSFYKNAVLAGLLIVYAQASFYSGEPLFDMWALSSFNFVNGFGIFFLGMFDRDVDRKYAKLNPILYAAGPNNEHMALRVTFRWITLVFVHVNIIYFVADTCMAKGSLQTPAFNGLLSNPDRSIPGDGDGGDLKVFGNVIFVILNLVLSLKVLYESGSIIHGRWPALAGCCKNAKEGFWSRVAYTWHGIIFLCIGFSFFFIYTYQVSIMEYKLYVTMMGLFFSHFYLLVK